MSECDNGNSDFPEQKGTKDLPPEVISHIFSFLTVADIQEARLVCSQWYEASQAPFLLEREKVVLSKEYGCPSPDELLKSNREFPNLCFMDVKNAAWYSDDFWNQLGPRLRLLSLRYCNIKGDELLKVLSHCERLKSLEISECECLFSSGIQIANTDNNKNGFPKLLHLQSLDIANIDDPSPELFDRLIDSAPNLTSLSLDGCLTTNFPRGEERVLTYQHVVEYLREKPHNINSLHITCCEDEDDEAFLAAAKLPNLRLERLQTDYSKVDAVLRCQRWLQEIDLHCIAKDLLVLTICVNLPTLKRLSLQYCSEVTFSGVVAISMLKNLTSLKLFQCCKVSGDAILTSLCKRVNTTLTELALTEMGLVSHLHIVALAKAYPALTHLDLSCCVGVTDWSLQAIFKYQRSLQVLKLTQCRNVSDVGLIGRRMTYCRNISSLASRTSLVCKYLTCLRCSDHDGHVNPTGYGISELKNLQKLNLDGCSLSGEAFMTGLKLPAIRHLILDNTRILSDAFQSLCENNPTIEILELSNCLGVTDALIPVIIRTLKRLRKIDVEDCGDLNDQSIKDLKSHFRKVKCY